ncbi:MAG TPA: hypothetical protein VE860_18640 [Chthoniobacterales bacterium]|jgi:hypothetical protein|nr:hypothetical protein [Chthoniobacterales bacterium]
MNKVLACALVVLSITATTPAQSLHKIREDVLAAYSKEDYTEMMSMFAIHDTQAVKSMVDKGKVVGIRKGSEVYLESIDLIARIAQVRPKGSNTTVWIPSDFMD